MTLTTLFIDLDETLYPSSVGLWPAIRVRMSTYMIERLRLPPDEVPALRERYFRTYGTTLRGLQKHHHVDASDYLAYVHDLPLEQYLQETPELRALLLSLPQRRWIFTNADANHARRVTARLGLDGCFDGIIDVSAMGFACKPEPEAYRIALELAGEPDPARCAILDDGLRNLAPARQMGMFTVLVGGEGASDTHGIADARLDSILDLRQALPFLWQTETRHER